MPNLVVVAVVCVTTVVVVAHSEVDTVLLHDVEQTGSC